MKILDRFIIRSYIGPLTVTFFICVFVLLMQFLWMYIDDLVGKGLAMSIIAELMLYASANLVPMALPLAVLLASIMVFGNLGENNELMAMKSSGIPLQRIMLPLIIFNIFIAINALLFTQFVLPYTNLRYGALLYDVRQQRPEINIKKGTFYELTSGLKLKIKDKDPETNMMYEVMIYDHRNIAGNMDVTLADSASMLMSEDKVFLIFTLYNGVKYEEVRDRNNYEYSRNNMPFKRQLFGEQKMIYELNGYEFSRTNTELFKHNYQMLNLKQLNHAQDSLQKNLLNKKVRNFSRMFLNNYFVQQERRENKNGVLISYNSTFNKLNTEKKIQVYERALNLARSAKSAHENNLRDIKNKTEWINKHKIEWHKKFTLSVACLILFFIGAPLGAIIRKGGFGVPVIVSIFFFLVYYILSMIGEKYVKAGGLIAYQGMWMASTILLPIGIYLTYKATHDSNLFNLNIYINPIKNIFKKLSKKKQL